MDVSAGCDLPTDTGMLPGHCLIGPQVDRMWENWSTSGLTHLGWSQSPLHQHAHPIPEWHQSHTPRHAIKPENWYRHIWSWTVVQSPPSPKRHETVIFDRLTEGKNSSSPLVLFTMTEWGRVEVTADSRKKILWMSMEEGEPQISWTAGSDAIEKAGRDSGWAEPSNGPGRPPCHCCAIVFAAIECSLSCLISSCALERDRDVRLCLHPLTHSTQMFGWPHCAS